MFSLSRLTNASFTNGIYSITPLGSIPHEQVTISFGSESRILFASSEAANPPKTTECMTPIQAHANIANTASGIIGI